MGERNKSPAHFKRQKAPLFASLPAKAKHLEACTTIHRFRDLEILHFVQNDIVSVQNDIVSVQNDAVYSADIVSAITNC